MEPIAAPLSRAETDLLRLHGFSESGSEQALRDLVQLAATFAECPALLALRDEAGIWFRTGVGLEAQTLADLEPLLSQRFLGEAQAPTWSGPGLQLVRGLWLLDGTRRAVGCLCLMAETARTLSPAQEAGLQLLAGQLSALVLARQEQAERRGVSRGPSGTSFVPGLVHELRNFIFGISASLDAFQARFGAQEETSKYGKVMRSSIDRLNAFLDELREYGDPQLLAFAERNLEPILCEAIEHHRPLAARNEVEVKLQCAGPLPLVLADDQSLRVAFVRLIDLALQQENPGGCLVIQVGTRLQGQQRVIYGYLDGAGLKLQDVDLARLFEPFYFRASGLGRLALPVARRIFEAHGGNLSAGPGPEGGMRMGFMLPAL